MGERTSHTGRRSRACRWLAATLLLAAACSEQRSEFSLDATPTAGGDVEFSLSGPAGAHAFVVLAPPLRGDEEIRAGLPGVHCSEAIPAELHAAGAGTQAQGPVAPEPLRGRIDAARLAGLPSPMILQALVSSPVDGGVQLRTSNAIVVRRSPDGLELQPFSAGGAIWRALPRVGLVVLVPLVVLLGLGRLRRLPRWLLPSLLAAVVGLRIVWPGYAPLWSAACGDEVERIDAHFDCGFAAALRFVAAPERANAPLHLQLGPQQTPVDPEIRAHWLRLLPRTNRLAADASLPAHGLLVRLAWPDPAPAGELLLRSGRFTVWGLGGQK
ncbi:MAG: hypothetical protein H6835_17320 [Planctomycetes bacterium]|nr:hypothetical protein [Planctomycetota bacterium]